MQVIGLTGGIGSGKSAAARIISSWGIPVIDADILARQAVQPGSPGLAHIVATFGPSVQNEDGTLNRQALAALVFADNEKRSALESIVHPEVRRLLRDQLDMHRAKATPTVIYEVPLLFEKGMASEFDATILVTCPLETRIARTMARDGSTAEAIQARIRAQMPDAQKAALASHVVENGGTLDELEAQLRRIPELRPATTSG